MLDSYLGAGIMFLMAIGIAVGMVLMTSILGPKREFADKMEPFECGESQIVSPHQRFSVKFYLVAVLFVLFDIEAVFVYPWALVFNESVMQNGELTPLLVFGEMMVFIGIILVGLIYCWRKGALDWNR